MGMKNTQKGFSAVAVLLIIVVIGLVGFAGWYVYDSNKSENYSENASTNTSQPAASDESTEAKNDSGDYQYSGVLRDVTMAKDVLGINTKGEANGIAKASFNDKYELSVTVKDVPDPKNDDFYEGWVVRKSPFKFISTGKLTKSGDKYINEYSSDKDLTAYDMYVLTIEPNDGDPAPAEHVVEGLFTQK